MSHVRLLNVTKKFGDVTAVNSLNLEIEKGECFSMLGPSGCGKTTTLRMVAGFEDLSEGEIYVGDRLISSPQRNYYLPPEKRNFGMVFQAFAVWPHLSVYDNVAFPLQNRNFPSEEIDKRTKDALRSTNLLNVADKSPADLSGDELRRLADALLAVPRHSYRTRGIEPARGMRADYLADADTGFRFRVFDREGRPCPRCGTAIVREALAGRRLYACPACQA